MGITGKNVGAYGSAAFSGKRAGTYEAVAGVFCKDAGVYGRVDAAPIVVIPTADLFFDDFNATDESLTGRTGWLAVGDATKAAKIRADGGLCRMLTGTNGSAPHGYQITSADPGEYRSVEFEYDYSQQGGTLSNPATPFQQSDQRFIVSWQDESNFSYLLVSPVDNRVTFSKTVAGTASEIIRYANTPAVGRLKMEFRGDRYRLWINDAIWAPDQLFNDALSVYPDRKFTGTVQKTGGAGVRHSFYPLNLTKVMRVNAANTVTIADPRTFYGRDTTNKRTISISGTYTGAPVSWVYRLRIVANGATVVDWAALAATAAAGAWSASVDVASGGPYWLDVGWVGSDGETRIATSSPFSVGLLVCYWGQSNASGMGAVGGGFSGSNSLYNAFDGSASHASSTYRRWFRTDEKPYQASYFVNAIGLAKSLADAAGIPVGVAAVGVASNAISTLKPGTANWDTVLVPFVTEIGGNVEAWVWSQGEAEGLSTVDYTNYVSDFALTRDGLRTIGGHPNAAVFVRIIGKDTNKTNTAAEITRSQAVRSILNGLESSENRVWVSSAMIGVPYTDALHPTNAGSVTLGRRDGLTIARRALGAIGYDGRGPLVTSATRSGATITLGIDLNGATGISGSALTGYSVSSDDFVTTLTISYATVSSNQIVITLSADPGAAVKVRSFREPNYNESSLALGSYSDGTTIPVFPIVDPITSN
jgi:hypothetical protein